MTLCEVLMDGKFLVLCTDCTVEVIELDLNNLLAEAYEIIGCSFLNFPDVNSKLRLIVDDMGGKYEKPLPVNPLASMLYAAPIFGTAILSGYREESGMGDLIGIDEEYLSTILEIILGLQFDKKKVTLKESK